MHVSNLQPASGYELERKTRNISVVNERNSLVCINLPLFQITRHKIIYIVSAENVSPPEAEYYNRSFKKLYFRGERLFQYRLIIF